VWPSFSPSRVKLGQMMHRNALEFCSVPHDDFEATV
jgi:hypothetical protein